MCLCETWLNSNFQNSELLGNLPYNIARRDRNKRGGGVIIIYRDTLIVRKQNISKENEIVHVDFVLNHNTTCTLVCFYRPPNYSNDENIRFFEELHYIASRNQNFVAVGDINIDYINPRNDSNFLKAKEFLTTCDLSQMVLTPTNKTKTKIIDWLIASSSEFCQSVTVCNPFLPTDHCAISCQLKFQILEENTNTFFKDFNNADFSKLDDYLS